MTGNRRWWNATAAAFVYFLLSGSPSSTAPAPAPAKVAPVVQVVTYYSGMPASSIEKSITNRIERWCNQAPGVRTITSHSIAGVSIVRVYFRDDIDPNDALLNTGKLALGTLPTLPPNTLPPVTVPWSAASPRPVGLFVVHGAEVRETELRQAARHEVREGLMARIKGAVVPTTLGGTDRTVLFYLDEKKLEARNLRVTDVIEVLRKSKFKAAYFGDSQILLNDTAEKPEEIRTLMVPYDGKQTVRLGDLGILKMEESPEPVRFRFDGHPAVGVPVFAVEGTRPRDLRERIAGKLADLKKGLPEKIKLTWVPFASESKDDPSGDGLLTVRVRAPSSSRLRDTEKRIAAVERFLEKHIPAKERQAILSEIGTTPSWAMYSVNAGPMDTTIFVPLSRERRQSAAAHASRLRPLLREQSAFADLGIRFASRDMPAPVDVRIIGKDRDAALRLAEKVRRRLADIKGTVDVAIAQRHDAPLLVLKPDAQKVAAVGLSAREVVKQFLTALDPEAGKERNFWIDVKDGEAYSFPLTTAARANLDNALNTVATGTNVKQPVKLSSLVSVKRSLAAVEIDHVDLLRVLDVRADLEGRNRREVVADIRKMISSLSVPEGLKVELANEP